MFKKLWPILLVLILVAVPLSASGCKMLKPPLGSEKNPIKLYFVPSVEVAVIIESGDAISAFLKQQTGYEFEVKVPTTYAAVIEELGSEADGLYANLQITTVPKGTRYRIDEYDGIESVIELEDYEWTTAGEPTP